MSTEKNKLTKVETAAVDLDLLKSKVAQYLQVGLEGSANTQRAYRADLKHYQQWCADFKVIATPIEAMPLSVYLAHLADTAKWSTIQRKLSAIRKLHELKNLTFPVKDRQVVAVLEGIRRTKSSRPKQAPAFEMRDFREILYNLDHDNPVELRNKVALLLGFTGAFRRSELVALDIDDLHFSEDGLLAVMKRSKTNQYGETEEKAFFFHSDPLLCPVRVTRFWLEQRPSSGPLLVRFRKGKKHGEVVLTNERLSDKSIDNIVKHYLGAEYSAHSLRASFVTNAKHNGADDLEVMQQTKHRTSLMIQRYTRTGNVRKFNAAKKLGL